MQLLGNLFPESPKLWDGQAWGLHCEVREKLFAFIQKNYPQSLPRIRAEISETGHKTEGETA